MAKTMPRLEETRFGSITIDGEIYDNDVIIRPDGTIKKRKKKLSKKYYGTSHCVSLEEIQQVLKDDKPEELYIGAGQAGQLDLSPEARRFVDELEIRVQRQDTPHILKPYNQAKSQRTALIHVTC